MIRNCPELGLLLTFESLASIFILSSYSADIIWSAKLWLSLLAALAATLFKDRVVLDPVGSPPSCFLMNFLVGSFVAWSRVVLIALNCETYVNG